jgi:ribonuclease PH
MSIRNHRGANELRDVTIETGFTKHPEGSVLIRSGDTVVICTASVDERVKDWLRGRGRGWVTAEYAMLPRANEQRNLREGQFGRWPQGRSQEIQRLIGRCLRGAVWPARLGERTVTIDCDVIQGDGGTRTASVTGGFVALALAMDKLRKQKLITKPPLKNVVAAVSVGIVSGARLLDLDYREDSTADVDLNLAAYETGDIIEVQGTAEGKSFSREDLMQLTDLALDGVAALTKIQRRALAEADVDLDALIDPREDLK